jgi:hypothetical protein
VQREKPDIKIDRSDKAEQIEFPDHLPPARVASVTNDVLCIRLHSTVPRIRRFRASIPKTHSNPSAVQSCRCYPVNSGICQIGVVIFSVLQIFYQEVELQEGQNKNRVSGPSHGQEARERTPEFFFGVACASPYRDEDPGCVGGEARQENLPKRYATVIKRDDVEGDNRDAGGNPVNPEYFPERLFTAPCPNLRSKKLGGKFSDLR